MSERTEVAAFRFFTVQREDLLGGKSKLSRYFLVSRKEHCDLASIRWYAQWRMWIFIPYQGTIWSDDCLSCIREFLGTLQAE